MNLHQEEFAIGLRTNEDVTGSAPAWFFVYRENKILWPGESDDRLEPLQPVATSAMALGASRPQFIGELAGISCYWLEPCSDYTPPQGYRWVDLRQTLGVADPHLFAMAGRARQIAYFFRTNRFCGVCGTETNRGVAELNMTCPACGHVHYPRISPCVIVLVTKGDYLLLAQGSRHPSGMYSTLAGFIEAGETCEQAIHREIREEVNLEVEQIRYFDSQVWPFPHQLMLGYFAHYKKGEIEPQPDEILEARWWHYKSLPNHPPQSTIAGRLIHKFVSERERGGAGC